MPREASGPLLGCYSSWGSEGESLNRVKQERAHGIGFVSLKDHLSFTKENMLHTRRPAGAGEVVYGRDDGPGQRETSVGTDQGRDRQGQVRDWIWGTKCQE